MGYIEDLGKECQELLTMVYAKVNYKSNTETVVELPNFKPDSTQVGFLVNQLKQRDFMVTVLPADNGVKLVVK